MYSLTCAVVLMEKESERSKRSLRIERKILRDASNPLDMDEPMFIKNYRLNKAAFTYVLSFIEDSASSARSSSITPVLRLSSVLRFLAEGGYQHGVGKDFDVPMGQSTFSYVLKDVLASLQTRLCPQWINLDMSANEKQQSKMEFYQKYRFPGIILCVDGTHIKIISPTKEKFLYYNRKGYYSINAMIDFSFISTNKVAYCCRVVTTLHLWKSHKSTYTSKISFYL